MTYLEDVISLQKKSHIGLHLNFSLYHQKHISVILITIPLANALLYSWNWSPGQLHLLHPLKPLILRIKLISQHPIKPSVLTFSVTVSVLFLFFVVLFSLHRCNCKLRPPRYCDDRSNETLFILGPLDFQPHWVFLFQGKLKQATKLK